MALLLPAEAQPYLRTVVLRVLAPRWPPYKEYEPGPYTIYKQQVGLPVAKHCLLTLKGKMRANLNLLPWITPSANQVQSVPQGA